MHKRISAGLLATLGWAVLQSTAMASSPLSGPSNYVNLYVIRFDDVCCPLEEFFVGIDVVVPGVAGVSGVEVETDAFKLTLELDVDGPVDGLWGVEMSYADFAAMNLELADTWTVRIIGVSPSTSTFMFSALSDANIFASATRVVPSNGETGVPPDVDFAWNAPPDTENADVLFVFVDSVNGIRPLQEDDSINGMLCITDTTWDPLFNLPPGPDEFGVFYANFPCLVTPLSTADSIIWGDSPLWPTDCLDSPTPLLVVGSGTIVGFDVCPWNCGGDNDGNVGIVDFLALLSQWGLIGTSCDIDGGGVGIVDFLALLANWGPCP